MPAQVTNYQCPSCTGPLHYDGAAGKLLCDYCGSSFDVELIEQLYADKNKAAQAADQPQWDTQAAGGQWGEDAGHLRAYNCPSCGAELLCDETTAATACPYCGNPTVIPGQFSGGLKPDLVIPFKLSREDAIAALKKHYKKKPLLPRTFAAQNQLEKIQGVYVPFWLFDCDTDGQACYDATKTREYRDGDYDVTETEHYRAQRSGVVQFRKVPVDGSSKMPDAHMDSIEPYDYSELREFSMSYLPGFLADKYDEDAAASQGRANQRIRNSFSSELAGTLSGYSGYTQTWADINLTQGQVRYALLPVWLLNTRWNDQSYLFAMNGQTGKLIGDLPIDKKRKWAYFFGVLAGVTAVLTLVLSLL